MQIIIPIFVVINNTQDIMENEVNYSKVWAVYELALCYFPGSSPKSATDKLSRWIRLSGNLKDKLQALNWHPGNKLFTPKQAMCIIDHLGEP